MAVAIEAVDIVAICACVLLLALLYLSLGLAKAIVRAFDVSILGQHPFAGIASALNNSIVSWINSAIGGVESAITTLWKGLIWSFSFMTDGITNLANGIEASLKHAWTVTLHNTFQDMYDWTSGQFKSINGSLNLAFRTIQENLTKAETYARQHAAAAEQAAERYVDSEVDKLHSYVASHVAASVKQLEAELTIASNNIGSRVDVISDELRRAERAAEQVIDLPADILKDLDKLAKEFAGAASIGALMAAIPFLLRELAAFERETGLDELFCRSKIKGVCGVDASLWANLLGGLVIADIGLHLEELLPFARTAMNEFADVIREAV